MTTNTTTTIDAATLLELIAAGRTPRMLDVRTPGEFEAAHIPGAVFADFLDEFSEPDGPFMFTLPTPERIARVAGAIGIGEGAHVVAYTQDLPTFAPRLWWLLRHYGFDAVSVLDGGLAAWRAAGRSGSVALASR